MIRHAARTAANSAAFLLSSRLFYVGCSHGSIAVGMPPVRGTRRCSTNGPVAANNETRCVHCFITFATPAELLHHAENHCFPDDPGQVLRRFPVGADALDTVSRKRVEVVGGASNPKKKHSSVSVRELERGLVADVPISRLRLVA